MEVPEESQRHFAAGQSSALASACLRLDVPSQVSASIGAGEHLETGSQLTFELKYTLSELRAAASPGARLFVVDQDDKLRGQEFAALCKPGRARAIAGRK